MLRLMSLTSFLLFSSFSLWAESQTKTTPPLLSLDRLKIGYFGALTGSTLGHWREDTGVWVDEAAGPKYEDSLPVNLWNQISFNYNFGYKFNFIVNPRWTNLLGNTRRMGKDEEKSLFIVEDLLTGFQGTLMNEQKNLGIWMRFGLRLPTSRASRHADITYQPEYMHQVFYDANPQWQFGHYFQFRWWVYEDTHNLRRFRTYFAPYISHAISDKTRLELYYQIYLENRNNHPDYNGREIDLKRWSQDAFFMVNHTLNERFTLMPYVGYVLEKSPITGDSFYLAAWISYSIK